MDAILHVKGLLHFTGRAQTEKVQEKKEKIRLAKEQMR